MRAPAKREVRAIVGIGASAGGLGAFGRFLKALPVDSGMAFVLVQHLDPAFPSELAHILSSVTKLPVTSARDGEPVRANRVYVLPSDGLLTLAGGRLRVAQRADGHPPVIDEFLTSLAADQGSSAIAVILSGSGSDGAKGVQAIKAAGGTTFAQDPATAEHGDMPRRAIESGAIDHVLAPEEIARAVLDPSVRTTPRRPPVAATEEDAFEEIREILQAATGVDFRHYKPSTLRRRIDRRLSAHGLASDLPGYAALLRRDAGAVAALYQDVLLHVTGFFRDPTSLDALKSDVLPDLIATCHANRPCRVWVPGCASGEEVYSIAICLLESKASAGDEFPIQIFGTDLSDTVLDAARRGWYPATIAGDVSADRLRQFFIRTGEGYQVAKRVREICAFSRHDVTRDPPFSRMDLISCRNVLIYFDATLQGRVLRVFHYALNPGGLLMLGPAEAPGMLGELFSLRDRAAKVYVRHPGSARLPPALGVPNLTAGAPKAASLARRQLSSLDQAVADTVVAELASPGVVVSSQLDILQFRGRTAPWLAPPSGEPTSKLLKMVHPDLRVQVGRVLRKARRDGSRAMAHALPFTHDGGGQWVTVRVLPVSWGESDQPCFLLVFEAVDRRSGAARGAETDSGGGASEQVAELQRELVETRDYLQALIEEQDRAHAELQAAHEDSLSVNEEFQSTNEELVTTKEEIQSINEELTTINDELRRRNAELQALNTDLANVLESVDIPVIICDCELRLRRFSPRARELFQLHRLAPHARLTEAELPLRGRELEELCQATLRDDQARSIEVQGSEGRWQQLRVLPYHDADGRTDGVVLALVDIDELRHAMDSVTRARDYSAAIVESVRHPMIVLDADLQVISANGQFWRKFRLVPAAAVGTRLSDLPGELWGATELNQKLETVRQLGQDFEDLELTAFVPDAGRRLFRMSGRKLAQVDTHPNHILVAVEDVTDRRLLDERLHQAAKLHAMGQLAGGVAHEINNQMQIALGFARDLLRELPPEDQRRTDLEHVIRASARSADVTRSLLAFTRQQLMRAEPVIVDDLMDTMARLLPKVVGPAVEIVFSCGADRRQVYADRAQLEQVLVNLALNARDAMPGGGRLFLETSAVVVDDDYRRQHSGISIEPGSYVRILVRDLGQGMDAATLARIFEPFFTTKPVGKGSGLGMASVYGTVKQSGGYVWVESRPGEGATVTIDLPERADARDTPRRLSGPSSIPPGGTETILVVDDEETLGAWVGRALDTLGYATLVAADGEAAVRMVESGARPNLLLTDVVMPKMAGRDVAARIEDRVPGIRVLYMSGHTRHEMVDRGLLDEHAPLLTKPFSAERLAETVREVLDARPASAGG